MRHFCFAFYNHSADAIDNMFAMCFNNDTHTSSRHASKEISHIRLSLSMKMGFGILH